MSFRQALSRFNPIVASSVRNYCSAGKLVDVQQNDKTGITTITMNRPPVNSLNLELLTGILNALQEASSNKTKGVILTSSSNSVFSAGLDIMEMYKPNEERMRKFWTALQDVWLTLYGSDYPTVAAINGHSPAGGCLLSLCCEYRIMLPNFTIGLNETKLGIVAPSWFQGPMKATIGDRQAELALTTGRMFTTDEALKVGLIDEIANDKADCLAKAEKFLSQFAKIPRVARSMTKLSVRSQELKNLEETRDQDLEMFVFFATQSHVQKSLGVYIEGLKKKQGAK